MDLRGQRVVDEAVSIIATQAELYRQRIEEQARRVEEYAQLSKRSELRESLDVIVDFGSGQEKKSVTRTELMISVNFVLTLLFSNPLTGQVKIPLDFWQTPLGTLINTANRRCTPFLDVLNPSEAAREVNLSRQTIYNWIEQGKLLPLWEHTHPFILRLELLVVAGRMTQETQPCENAAAVG